TVPLSVNAILEMAVYYFVNSMITVSAVVFIYSTTTKLASVAILNLNDAGDVAAAAAMSMIILGINIVIRSIYEVVNKKIGKRTNRWLQR
ncbi:MAG: putative 2-aminoethylphosphonate ABC transporter permease subunit, partial [Anaerovoracaceae bacterium]